MKRWGAMYGDWPMVTRRGRRVWLWREGQRCRWYDGQGRQVGPEQSNVAPALAYAYAKGWREGGGPWEDTQ